MTLSRRLCGGSSQHPLFVLLLTLHLQHPGNNFFQVLTLFSMIGKFNDSQSMVKLGHILTKFNNNEDNEDRQNGKI